MSRPEMNDHAWFRYATVGFFVAALALGTLLAIEDRLLVAEQMAADEIKRRSPDTKIVWGGWLPGFVCREAALFCRVKHIGFSDRRLTSQRLAALPLRELNSLESVYIENSLLDWEEFDVARAVLPASTRLEMAFSDATPDNRFRVYDDSLAAPQSISHGEFLELLSSDEIAAVTIVFRE